MTRLLLCAILVVTACQAHAATLYRWIEADGSITFSPEPPPAGIAYDIVQTGGNSKAQAPAVQTAQSAPQRPAQKPLAPQVSATAAQQQPRQGLNYAPSAGAAPQNSITRATNLEQTQRRAGTANQNGVVTSTKKFNQCQDLQKRVVSLERRLRSKLTPDEVDNTVVAIVRYQQSFDQYCL